MSELSRVKESCAPCRKRKSRCNDQVPCSSCVLRGTEAQCTPHGGSSSSHRNSSNNNNNIRSRSASPPLHQPQPLFRRRSRDDPHSSPAHAQPELDRLRDLVDSLEDKVRSLQRATSGFGSGGAASGSAGGEEAGWNGVLDEATREDRECWLKVEEALPPLPAVEILLEFLHQECDWLYYRPHLLPLWRRAMTARACTPSQAGILLVSLALAAHLLGPFPTGQPFYRPMIDTATLHPRLFALARTFLPTIREPLTKLSELQLHVDLIWYSIYTAQHVYVVESVMIALQGALNLGILDETGDSWRGLDEVEKDYRRRMALAILSSARWMLLRGDPDPLAAAKIAVRPPQPPTDLLKGPIHLPRPRSATSPHSSSHPTPSSSTHPFPSPRSASTTHPSPLAASSSIPPPPPLRIFRLHTPYETHRTQLFEAIGFEFTSFHPRINAYQHLLRDSATMPSLSDLASKCYAIHSDLVRWRETRLIANGFTLPSLEDFDGSDALATRYLSQSLCLHHGLFHVSAVLTRPWLALGDENMKEGSKEKALHDACLENAEESLRTLGLVKVTVDSRSGPLITPWIATNTFNAAMSFAIPVLRAVRRVPSANAFDAISTLFPNPLSPVGHFNEPSPPADSDARRPSSTLPQQGRDDGLSRVPLWPEPVAGHDHNSQPAEQTHGLELPHISHRLPPEIYADAKVRRCAANILAILDGMSMLKTSPLGVVAEKRLAELIHQTGLRESPMYSLLYEIPLPVMTGPPAPYPFPTDAKSAEQGAPLDWGFGGPASSTTQAAWPSWDPAASTSELGGLGVGVDAQVGVGVFEQLLQVDGRVWQELLAMGAGLGI